VTSAGEQSDLFQGTGVMGGNFGIEGREIEWRRVADFQGLPPP
jgi:hypothetical protein